MQRTPVRLRVGRHDLDFVPGQLGLHDPPQNLADFVSEARGRKDLKLDIPIAGGRKTVEKPGPFGFGRLPQDVSRRADAGDSVGPQNVCSALP